jgi:hypothetical protein
LVVLDDLEKTYITPDEFEDVFRERMILSPSPATSDAEVKKGIVSNSSNVAEEIRNAIMKSLSRDSDTQREIQIHASQMRKALSNSSQEFLSYIKKNLPDILEPMESILKEKGENLVLLGLQRVSAR